MSLARGFAAALGFAFLVAPGIAEAQSVKSLGTFHDWSAYSAAANGGTICFAVAKPSAVTPQPSGYKQAYLYVTQRPADQISNEVNLIAGFPLSADQPATLSVDGKDYPLFARDDSAWLKDPTQNDNLAGAMRAGSSVAIALVSQAGDKVEESFSLDGATAAARAVAGAC